MKTTIILALCLALVIPVWADPWTLGMDASLLLTQNSYSDNWVGGEAGSISWIFNLNGLAEKQLSPKMHNKNTLKLSFGQTHNQSVETKEWAKPTKSTDLIDFESVLRFTLGAFVDPYVSFRFESQFLDQSDPTKNRMFNPMTFTESAGIAKVFIQEEKRELSTRLGFGFRQHTNRDVLIDPINDVRETQSTNDGGILSVTDFKTPLAQERILFTSKLTLYKAIFYSEEDALVGLPNEDYWKEVDINWENIFSASITKYLMVNLYTQLLYDKELDLAGRFKETLSLGLTYKFI